jgi:hypothetical protein
MPPLTRRSGRYNRRFRFPRETHHFDPTGWANPRQADSLPPPRGTSCPVFGRDCRPSAAIVNGNAVTAAVIDPLQAGPLAILLAIGVRPLIGVGKVVALEAVRDPWRRRIDDPWGSACDEAARHGEQQQGSGHLRTFLVSLSAWGTPPRRVGFRAKPPCDRCCAVSSKTSSSAKGTRPSRTRRALTNFPNKTLTRIAGKEIN